jgi:hypothetical protein
MGFMTIFYCLTTLGDSSVGQLVKLLLALTNTVILGSKSHRHCLTSLGVMQLTLTLTSVWSGKLLLALPAQSLLVPSSTGLMTLLSTCRLSVYPFIAEWLEDTTPNRSLTDVHARCCQRSVTMHICGCWWLVHRHFLAMEATGRLPCAPETKRRRQGPWWFKLCPLASPTLQHGYSDQWNPPCGALLINSAWCTWMMWSFSPGRSRSSLITCKCSEVLRGPS